MKPGRRPQPPELRLIKGVPGHRRLPKREGKIPVDSRPPSFLKGEARAEWDRIAPMLRQLGLLTSLDHTVLACYCIAVAQHKWAVETIRKEGHFAIAKNGKKCAHPAHLIERQAAATIHRLSCEFGMTPSARAGLDITGKTDLDPYEFD